MLLYILLFDLLSILVSAGMYYFCVTDEKTDTERLNALAKITGIRLDFPFQLPIVLPSIPEMI